MIIQERKSDLDNLYLFDEL